MESLQHWYGCYGMYLVVLDNYRQIISPLRFTQMHEVGHAYTLSHTPSGKFIFIMNTVQMLNNTILLRNYESWLQQFKPHICS